MIQQIVNDAVVVVVLIWLLAMGLDIARRLFAKLFKSSDDMEFQTALDRELYIIGLLERIAKYTHLALGQRAKTIKLKWTIVQTNQQGEENMQLQLGQDAQITISGFADAAGNAALVDGAPKWAIAGDQSLGTLTVADDGMSALFARNGGVGVCTVQVSADADLSPEVSLITGSLELDCLGGVATQINIVGTAVPSAVVAPPVVVPPVTT